MSRAKLSEKTVEEKDPGIIPVNVGGVPPMLEEPGLAGPYSLFPVTQTDERVRQEVTRLLEAARAIRPLLREQQQETEDRGGYSQEVHEYFIEHGFYKTLLPRRFGGHEIGAQGYFQVISEIGRGCPSTSWGLALASAHTLTLSSYWPIEVQEKLFGEHGYMIAPASGNPNASSAVRVDGGFEVTGTWRYCSGSTYATHFFPTVILPESEAGPARRAWGILERSQFEILDDWGGIIGMRGSGSNSIRAVSAFIPDEYLVGEYFYAELDEPTVGYELHQNPLYSGVFFGFGEGEVASAAVGLGYAAIDEYERIIRSVNAPFGGGLRVESDDYRRPLGLALAKVDTAASALFEQGRRYEEHARQLTDGVAKFDGGTSMAMNNVYFEVEALVQQAIDILVRAAGSSAMLDGKRMQRYFRDIWTTVTRADQIDLFASPTIRTRIWGGMDEGEGE